jgi:DNA polymerase (family 10)
MKNLEPALLFERMGDALEFKGGNRFKIAACRKAALALRDLDGDVERLFDEGRLREVPGVGEGIAQKIKDVLTTYPLPRFRSLISKK